MSETVTRTWWITDDALSAVDIEYFVEEITRSNDTRLRMHLADGRPWHANDTSRVAFNRAAIEYLLRTIDVPPYVHACIRPESDGGYYVSVPGDSIPLRKVIKSRPARSGETPGEVW